MITLVAAMPDISSIDLVVVFDSYHESRPQHRQLYQSNIISRSVILATVFDFPYSQVVRVHM